MHGHGQPQPPQPPQSRSPRDVTLVLLRVLFVALPLLTCGFLAWAPMLRVAILARNRWHWILFCAAFALNVLWLAFLFADNTEDLSSWQGNTGMVGMLTTGSAAIAFFLYADIRHYRKVAMRSPGHLPQPFPPHGYGYPHQQSLGHAPVAPAPAPQNPYVARTQPPTPAQNPYTAQPQPQPQPQIPSPPQPEKPRIDQVRAELDELSDYLRKEQGRGQDR